MNDQIRDPAVEVDLPEILKRKQREERKEDKDVLVQTKADVDGVDERQ